MSRCNIAVTVTRTIILIGLLAFLFMGFLTTENTELNFTLAKELNFSSLSPCLEYKCWVDTMQCWACKPVGNTLSVHSYSNRRYSANANLFMSFESWSKLPSHNVETYSFFGITYEVHIYTHKNLLETRKTVSAWPTYGWKNVCQLDIHLEPNQNINFWILIPIGFITISFLWELVIQVYQDKNQYRRLTFFD